MTERTEQLEEFLKLSKSDLTSTKTQRLQDYIRFTEEWMLEELDFDKVDYDKLWDEDEELGDTVFEVREILRERLSSSSKYMEEDLEQRIKRLEKKADGMQTAIDKLKEHGHDGEISTFKVTYPGRRD